MCCAPTKVRNISLIYISACIQQQYHVQIQYNAPKEKTNSNESGQTGRKKRKKKPPLLFLSKFYSMFMIEWAEKHHHISLTVVIGTHGGPNQTHTQTHTHTHTHVGSLSLLFLFLLFALHLFLWVPLQFCWFSLGFGARVWVFGWWGWASYMVFFSALGFSNNKLIITIEMCSNARDNPPIGREVYFFICLLLQLICLLFLVVVVDVHIQLVVVSVG